MKQKFRTDFERTASTPVMDLLLALATIAVIVFSIRGCMVVINRSVSTYTTLPTEITRTPTQTRKPILPMIEIPSTYLTEPPCRTRDIELLSRMVWGEARGLSPGEQRLTVWTVFQRVDYPYKWGDTIEAVITQPWQFIGYNPNHPICPDIYMLVYEELNKWLSGEEPPTLYPFAPSIPYFFFDSDPSSSLVPHNFFRGEW